MNLLKQLVKKNLNLDAQEELRRIRTLLYQKKEVKVIQFVASNESKSIYQLTYDLAESFSLINKKTVLVNFNLRNEVLFSEYLSKKAFIGLDAYLTRHAMLSDMIISINEHFDLITNKIKLPNSTDYLSEDKLLPLFESLQRKYDYVFIISPALRTCYDALILGEFSDGLLYIKEDRLPSKSVLNEHASLLNQLGKPILGIVITNIDL